MSNEIKFDVCPICGKKKDATICSQCGWEFKIYANPMPEALQVIENQRLNIAKTVWQKCQTGGEVKPLDDGKLKSLEERLEKANEKIKNQTEHIKILEEKKTETESKLKEATEKITKLEAQLSEKPVSVPKNAIAYLIAENDNEECIYCLFSGINSFCGPNGGASSHQEIPIWTDAKSVIEINVDPEQGAITLKETSTGQTFALAHGSKFKIGSVKFRINIAL